jgi:hypothetical protein
MVLRRSPSSLLAANFGTATLVGGTAANIAALCPTNENLCTIILSRNTPGGTLGFLSAPSSGRVAGEITFDLASLNGADVSTVNWLAIPKNTGLGSTTFINSGSLRRPPSGKFVARGTATLVAGTVTVTTPQPFSAAARVFVMAHEPGGTQGHLSAPQASVNPTTSQFVINSSNAADVSTVDWILIDEPLRFSPSGTRMAQSAGQMVGGSASFTQMLPMLQTDISVLASVIDAGGTSGFLYCSNANRPPTRTDGGVLILSTAAETSLIESAIF